MSDNIKYTRKYDRRVKWITFFSVIVIGSGLVYLYLTSGGSYFPAWVTVLLLALLALAALSIPRFLIVSGSSVEIHCLMELTTIPLEDIISIRQMEQKEMKSSIPIPLLGIYGIFGYYGYYINLRTLKIFKVYSQQWNNFVAIENIYEDMIVVSVDNPGDFIRLIESRTNLSNPAEQDS